MTPQDVLNFWFEEHNSKDWYGGKAEFDDVVRSRFGALLKQAERSELFVWRTTAHGRLAEIIVLDQFTRQLYRQQASSFACDSLALALAQEAVALGLEKQLNPVEHQFLLMPYMHSESLVIHEEAVRLFAELGNENILKFEMAHRDILLRFGRYPKRNEALGRPSTPQELEYMADNKGMF